jgi:hypothetical protein
MGITNNPAALSQFGLISGIGSAVSGGIGSYYSALGQKQALQFQAQVADQNALHAATAGEQRAGQVLQQGSQIEGSQRAGFAANGVDLTEGSPAAVLASTEVMRQNDAATTMNNAMQEAFGYQTDAAMKRATAGAISPVMSGVTTLIDGASKVGSQWAAYSSKGSGSGAWNEKTGKGTRLPASIGGNG